MSFSDETYRRIQAYLDNEMNPEDRVLFEKEMAAQPELAAEVKLNQEAQLQLSDTPENQLLQNLQALSDQFEEPTSGGNKYWYLLLILPLIAAGVWWFSAEQPSLETKAEEEAIEVPQKFEQEAPEELQETPLDTINEEVEEELIQASKVEPEENDLPKTPKEEVVPEKEEKTVAEKKTPKSSTQRKPSEQLAENPDPEVNPENPPIPEITIGQSMESISVEPTPSNTNQFDPNPTLEALINTPSNGDIRMRWTKKQKDSESSDSGDIQFNIAGDVISRNDIRGQQFQLYIFSNDPAAYDNFQAISENVLRLKPGSGTRNQFIFNKQISLQSGLYYYMIKDNTNTETYLTAKFIVQ